MKSVASMAVSLPSRRGAAHLARSRSLKGSARRAAAHLARPRSLKGAARRAAAHLARPRPLKGSARMLRSVARAHEEATVAEELQGNGVPHPPARSRAGAHVG